MAVKICVSF